MSATSHCLGGKRGLRSFEFARGIPTTHQGRRVCSGDLLKERRFSPFRQCYEHLRAGDFLNCDHRFPKSIQVRQYLPKSSSSLRFTRPLESSTAD